MRGLLAAVAAWMLLAAPAGAVTILATVMGDYNDDPRYSSWVVELRYDPSLASPSATGLQWSAADGTPSPLFSVTGRVHARQESEIPYWYEGTPGTDFGFRRTVFTSFEIIKNAEQYLFIATSPSGNLGLGLSHAGYFPDPFPLTPSPPLRFTDPYLVEYDATGEYGDYGVYTTGSPHTHALAITAVPEPATWAMMIVGFGLLGASLRQRRQRVDHIRTYDRQATGGRTIGVGVEWDVGVNRRRPR